MTLFQYIYTLHIYNNSVYYTNNNESDCKCPTSRRGICSYSSMYVLLPTWTAYRLHFFLWLMGSCDDTGLATCSLFVWWAWELWNMGSNVRGRQAEALYWQGETVQLHGGCLHFLCTNGERPFVNSSAGSGWAEMCVCIDGVRGGEAETYFSTLFKSCWC